MSGALAVVGIGEIVVEGASKLLIIRYADSGATLNELAGFAEFVIFWSENHWHTVGCGFERVVDSLAESAANVGQLSVAVERREQTYAVYNQYVCTVNFRFIGLGVGVAVGAGVSLGMGRLCLWVLS